LNKIIAQMIDFRFDKRVTNIDICIAQMEAFLKGSGSGSGRRFTKGGRRFTKGGRQFKHKKTKKIKK
jgi:hypothetical protein